MEDNSFNYFGFFFTMSECMNQLALCLKRISTDLASIFGTDLASIFHFFAINLICLLLFSLR